jgi:hypothetical protein
MRRWSVLSVVKAQIVGCDSQHLVGHRLVRSYLSLAVRSIAALPVPKICLGSVKPIVLPNWHRASTVIWHTTLTVFHQEMDGVPRETCVFAVLS